MKPSASVGLWIATAAMSSSALAQTAPSGQLQTFVASPQYQAYIGRLFSRLPPDVFQRCPALVSQGSTVSTMSPVAFAPDGHPVSGSWKQSFPVSGCGNDTTINLFFAAQQSENIVTTLGAPGGTHADPVLQKDAVKLVMLAVHLKAPSCAAPHVIHTSYDHAAEKTRITSSVDRPWHETWVVSACGTRWKLGIAFVPDATGTQMTTEPAEAAG